MKRELFGKRYCCVVVSLRERRRKRFRNEVGGTEVGLNPEKEARKRKRKEISMYEAKA